MLRRPHSAEARLAEHISQGEIGWWAPLQELVLPTQRPSRHLHQAAEPQRLLEHNAHSLIRYPYILLAPTRAGGPRSLKPHRQGPLHDHQIAGACRTLGMTEARLCMQRTSEATAA